MAVTKELDWGDLTESEKEAAVSCGRLSNPQDFQFHRVAGELYACDDEAAWIATVSSEHSEEYPDAFAGIAEGDDAYLSAACLIPITTNVELDEDKVCSEYLGVSPAHVRDFTVGS